ncbi:hypothetical protein VARIO8X_20289 [Burkholderiales bacterium 8X]|nr:hypothetical protein VARIO8X_20289 [Burkholderiales bacterium 8X]
MQEADQETDRLARLRLALQCRRAEMLAVRERLVEARQDLIESLGGWMCGGLPPQHEQIDELVRLTQQSEEVDLAYAEAIRELVAQIGGCPRPD